MLGLAGDRGVGLRVHGRTRGNPFLVTELLAAGSDGAGLPASVSEAVLGRLARLDPGPRDLVDRVAVVPARAEGSLLDALHPAWRADAAPAEELGLLELRDGGLAFRHELARTAVEEALPRTRRLRLDDDVVRVLLAGPDPDLARVLHHAARCKATAVVVDHGPAAARAAAAGAHRQSLDFYTLLLPHIGALPVEERAAVLEEYAWELYNAHRFDAAADAAARAVGLREELGDPARLGQALVTLSRQQYMRADMAAARTTVDRAFAALAGTGDRARLALARTYRGVLLALSDHEEEALAELAEARELAAEVGRRDLVALCLNYQGLARIQLGEPEAGLELLRRSVREAEAIGHQEYVARAYTSMVKGLRRAGRFTEMERTVSEGLDRTREADFLAHAYTLEAHDLLLRAVRGDWADAEAGLAELVDTVPDAGVLGRETLPLLARLRVRRGAPDAAASLDRSWDLARRADILQALAPTAVAAVEQAWLAGEPVPDAVDPVLARTARRGAERYRGELLRYLARAGRPAEPFPGCPEEYAAGLRGDWRAAAAAWEHLGDPYERALELAESGRPEPTLQALQLLDELGAEPAALLVRRRLRDLGITRIPRGPLPATRDNPAGLTDRQVEILRLVARGRTNAEIAAALVLSVRTVDHHVSAVLQKLGVATRREAAARAPDLLGPDDRARQ
ncbi:AAA family ATPase [Pseudonocardia halophobica]|uniref:LuxR family transcriptional regulator n=1 Tax=Pseudonocardia halophobica TaxID=29401 RepID=A0A9W6L141_9PSEU|nr:LuxR family transcriptional regulator [Pseudonocardia halophobica]GLL10266.1 LuxR family transcriptional regulator [Pseudonocardia halophobica]